MTENKKSGLVTGLGITGLVLGILTLIVSFIPCFGIFAIYIGILAIVISIIGLVISIIKKDSKGLLIAAMILSLLGCIIAFSQYKAIDDAGKQLEKEMRGF